MDGGKICNIMKTEDAAADSEPARSSAKDDRARDSNAFFEVRS